MWQPAGTYLAGDGTGLSLSRLSELRYDLAVLIRLHELRKRYGNIVALDGLSAEIDGKIIGLLGPNGAGKSTLIKCLLGLIPHEGTAEVLGLPSRQESFAIRDRVGYMPEIDSYLPGMSAVELCTYAAELSGLPQSEAMQRAHAALYYAGLGDKRYLSVDGYSTGMKQRVKLAQALVHDPELLFLDEPTNGLDPGAREDMLDLIAGLPERRGCAIILSTHLLPDVERICDQVLIMHKGRMRFFGPTRSLGAGTHGNRYEIEVKGNLNELVEALAAAGCEAQPTPPLSLTVTLPEGMGTGLLFAKARAVSAQIRRLEPQRESLEDAFLRAVGGEQ